MNYIDLALIAVVLVFAIIGIYRGFLLSMLHFGSSIVAGIAAKILSVPASSLIYDNFFKKPISGQLLKLMPSGSVQGELQSVIDKAFSGLPDIVSNATSQFGLYPDAAQIASGTGTYTVEYIENDILRPIISNIIAMIVVIILFIVFVFILRLVCYFINRLLTNKKKHKIINRTNKLLGGLFGLLKGIIPAGLAAVAINLIASYSDNASFLAYASQSVVCNFVSDLFR